MVKQRRQPRGACPAVGASSSVQGSPPRAREDNKGPASRRRRLGSTKRTAVGGPANEKQRRRERRVHSMYGNVSNTMVASVAGRVSLVKEARYYSAESLRADCGGLYPAARNVVGRIGFGATLRSCTTTN